MHGRQGMRLGKMISFVVVPEVIASFGEGEILILLKQLFMCDIDLFPNVRRV